MRKYGAVLALFPTLRGRLLTTLFLQPDRWWYLSELAARLATTPSSLQRDLSALAGCGILQRRRDGRRAYFKADERSPLFPELVGLIKKTAGVMPTLREVLDGFGARIDFAFVYGSVARRMEHSQSDVDLLVVGTVGLADLAPALREAETRLGREVNVTSYSPREFAAKASARDHFLSSVLRGPIQFVKGSQHDLDEALERASHPPASHVKRRAR